jgi:hypothetical protein
LDEILLAQRNASARCTGVAWQPAYPKQNPAAQPLSVWDCVRFTSMMNRLGRFLRRTLGIKGTLLSAEEEPKRRKRSHSDQFAVGLSLNPEAIQFSCGIGRAELTPYRHHSQRIPFALVERARSGELLQVPLTTFLSSLSFLSPTKAA